MDKKKVDDPFNLARFVNTQSLYYPTALAEIKAGKKKTHWIWFIWPQLKDLGMSENAKFYGLTDLGEAKAYLKNKILRERLIEITEVLLGLETDNPEDIFGWPDDMKVRSSMTLFELAEPEINVFGKVLEKYYNGERDDRTLRLLGLFQ